MAKVTLKAIDTKIGTFNKSRDRLKALGHEILMMIFHHAAPKEVSDDCNGTGDCTRALHIVKEAPKSWAEQMERWFKAYTPIRVIAKNDKCEYDPEYKKLSSEDKLAWWKLAEANENPFYSFVEKDVDKPDYDFEALLKMITRVGPAIEKKIKDNKVKAEDVVAATALARAVNAFRFERPVEAEPANQNTPATSPVIPEGSKAA